MNTTYGTAKRKLEKIRLYTGLEFMPAAMPFDAAKGMGKIVLVLQEQECHQRFPAKSIFRAVKLNEVTTDTRPLFYSGGTCFGSCLIVIILQTMYLCSNDIKTYFDFSNVTDTF